MNVEELNFAYKVRHALNENLDALPASTTGRLASARKMALSRKKTSVQVHATTIETAVAGSAGGFLNQSLSWLGRISIAAPLLAGVVLFISLYQYEQQHRISETADIDVAVLTDELPLTAYLDHGFNAYLAKRVE
ncbi:MAG TPA: DUF3619 family protein [Burkholderiaceae bacterium]|nr:DUF3619 family protein [Burkholderiaceae bacterium]